MTTKEVKHRRGTNSQVMAAAYAEAELIYNISKKRFTAGDGATVGGIPLASYGDVIGQSFTSAVTGGTGNDYTLTLEIPIAAYAGRQIFSAIVDRSNTGAATLNVSGNGAVGIRKKSLGALVDLEAGDMIAGACYMFMHNGAYIEVMNELSAVPPIVSVSQGDLNTSTGSVSASAVGSSSQWAANVVLPGGSYGFWPTIAQTVGGPGARSGTAYVHSSGATLADAAYIHLIASTSSTSSSTSCTVTATQKYIASSPPFDLGDGEVEGFIYGIVDGAGHLVSSYAADVPPWAYNGPTAIKAARRCPVTGEKQRHAIPHCLDDYLFDASCECQYETITHELKNADMGIIPHPYISTDIPDGCHVVMLDPMSEKIGRIIEYQNLGGSAEVLKSISDGYITADNEPLSRCGPDGVMIVRPKFKTTRRI